jgi:hypothetical protein
MKSTNISVNKKTWGVAISGSTNTDSVVILTHEEILAQLPELLRHNTVADAIKKIVLIGIRNFASVELPMVGTGRIAIKIEKTTSDNPEGIKTLLLANVSRELFSTPVKNILRAARICFIYELTMYDLPDLLKCRGMGKKSYAEVVQFIENNYLNDEELVRKLKLKESQIERIECSSIPAVAGSKAFQDLKEMIKQLDDIEHITLEKLYHGAQSRFIDNAFPYRYSTDLNFVKTKYEEKFFKKEDVEIIQSMANEVGKILHEYYDTEMRTFIKEM